jgi:ketosteroid isomerase-like protein
MKRFFFLLVVITNLNLAQTIDWKRMIMTENMFAAKTAESNMRDGFLMFIAEDGILFRPAPIKGKEYLQKSEAKEGFLKWYPTISSISTGGDMGFTSGPWYYMKDKSDTSGMKCGEFCTVWQKQNDGFWKFEIDYGIDHPKYNIDPKPFKTEDVSNQLPPTINGEFLDISELDKKQSSYSVEDLSKLYFEKTRFLVDGNFPFDGSEVILKFLKDNSYENFSYNPSGGKLSIAANFGFSYGELTLDNRKANSKKEIYYMRVWNLEETGWKLLAEVWNDKPAEKKN